MTEFDLLKTTLNKDALTGRVAITDSIQFRVSVSIAVAAILAILTLGLFDFDVPEWANALLSFSYVIGYTFALIALLFSRNAGTVKMGLNEIQIEPKNNPDKFPESPVQIDDQSEIHISVIQSAKLIVRRTLLHVEITKGDETSEFGILLRNNKKHQQYYEVLESWYRAGYAVKEFDQIGGRIFKLNQGKNYADIQKIKKEYDLEW